MLLIIAGALIGAVGTQFSADEKVGARNSADTVSLRTSFLFSRSSTGGMPDGPSRNGAVGHDQRIARVIAYESDASNIVPGDVNGLTDVFMVRRATPWGANGTPWLMSAAEPVSTGLGGSPANGRSYRPSVNGSSHSRPNCVAFISEASNLVGGDTNGVADVFVRNIDSGRIVRASVNSSRRQANGPSFDVSVSGDCRRVAFTSSATNLSLRRTSKLAWRSSRSTGSGGGFRQVYVRVLGGSGRDGAFKGMTFMASAGDYGRPGNNDSFEPDFARAGKAVVFTSLATNLDRGDRRGLSDVYRRTFTRRFTHIDGRGVQTLDFDTRLVSATRTGRAGDGPSQHPSTTDSGRYVAYETTATNLLAGDVNGVSDIARADMSRRRPSQAWVSKGFLGIGNGASNRPAISGAGDFVLFDSDSTVFKPSTSVRDDANGVRDLFLWNAPTRNVSLESRDWENGYLGVSSANAATSSRGNYVLFESAAPRIDELIANSTGKPQLYLRYLGPQ